MQNKKFKAIAFDVDGTIVQEGLYKINPEVKKAIKEIESKIEIIFATGRSAKTMRGFFNELEISPKHLVVGGGSEVFCPNNNLLFSASIQAEKYLSIKNNFKNKINEFYIMSDSQWTSKDTDLSKIKAFGLVTKGQEFSRKVYEELVAFCPELMITFATDETSDNAFFIYGSEKNANKGAGLKLVLDKMNISLSDTIAVGDSHNDIAMLEIVGLPVVMGQSPDEIKKYGKYITSRIDERGVLDLIEKFILPHI